LTPDGWSPLVCMMMPGVKFMTWNGSRAVGSASRRSRVNVAPVLAVLVSTMGESAVTVTSVSTAPTSIFTSICALPSVVTRTPSRMNVLNPLSSNVILYNPFGMLGI
jgi:hypothetical protein